MSNMVKDVSPILDFTDRYVLCLRELGKDLVAPNRAACFGDDGGGFVSFLWNMDLTVRIYYLIFLKKYYNYTQVKEHILQYRFKLYKNQELRPGDISIISYQQLDKNYGFAMTNHRQPPKDGLDMSYLPKHMNIINPEAGDKEDKNNWAFYENPVQTGLLEIIMRNIHSSYKDFPQVVLGAPVKGVIGNSTSGGVITTYFDIAKKSEHLYCLSPTCNNIEGLGSPESIWNALWGGIVRISKMMDGKIDIAEGILPEIGEEESLKKEVKLLGFDMDGLFFEKQIYNTIENMFVYQKYIKPSLVNK